MTPHRRRIALLAVALAGYMMALSAVLHWHAKTNASAPLFSSVVAVPPAPAPLVLTPPLEFDMKKRDRQWDWCCAHHGVPTMTFTINQSNVLCLKPEVVIAPPLEDVCR